MIPIVSIPIMAREYILPLTRTLKNNEVTQFEKYFIGLLISDNKTITGINKLFVTCRKDQSTLNRFLTESDWSIQEINHERLKLLKAHPKTRIKYSGIVAIDDTLNVHYGKHFEGISKLFDTKEQRYVYAHNIVTSEYVDSVTDYPLDFRLYEQLDIEKTIEFCKSKGVNIDEQKISNWKPSRKRRHILQELKKHKVEHPFLNKLDLAIELVDSAIMEDYKCPFAFDIWYTQEKLCSHIRQKERDYIGSLKYNCLVNFHNKEMHLNEYVSTLTDKDFQIIEVKVKDEQTDKNKSRLFQVHSVLMYINHLKKTERVVICRTVPIDEKEKVQEKYFDTNRHDWEAKHIVTFGQRRWGVERYYEDSKDNLGQEDYEIRDLNGIKRHWQMVFCAYSFLKMGLFAEGVTESEKNIHNTIGSQCSNAERETIMLFVRYLYECFRQGKTPEEAFGLLKM